jgi:hypothetical protein
VRVAVKVFRQESPLRLRFKEQTGQPATGHSQTESPV